MRHHLIDVLPPAAEFSAGDFYDLARPAIADILGRGRVPVVVGGTGFYLRWLIRGKPATAPSSPEAQRRAVELVQAAWARAAAAAVEQEAQEAAVEQEATQEVAAAGGDAGTGGAAEAPEEAAAAGPSSQGEGGGAGQRQQDHDDQQQQHQQRVSKAEWRRVCAERRRAARGAAPPTAKELRDGNMPPDPPPGLSREALWAAAARVVADLGDPAAAARVAAERHNWYRLMRVCQILISNPGKTLAELDADAAAPPDFDFRCFFLHRPRAALYDRIAYRVEEMVAGGLLQEAKALLDAGVAPGGCPAARAIGYRQAMEFLEAARARAPAPPTREQLLGLVFAIGTATRKLVKSQHTWFRDDALFRWVDAAAAAPEAVADFILAEVAKPEHEGACARACAVCVVRRAERGLLAVARITPCRSFLFTLPPHAIELSTSSTPTTTNRQAAAATAGASTKKARASCASTCSRSCCSKTTRSWRACSARSRRWSAPTRRRLLLGMAAAVAEVEAAVAAARPGRRPTAAVVVVPRRQREEEKEGKVLAESCNERHRTPPWSGEKAAQCTSSVTCRRAPSPKRVLVSQPFYCFPCTCTMSQNKLASHKTTTVLSYTRHTSPEHTTLEACFFCDLGALSFAPLLLARPVAAPHHGAATTAAASPSSARLGGLRRGHGMAEGRAPHRRAALHRPAHARRQAGGGGAHRGGDAQQQQAAGGLPQGAAAGAAGQV